MSEHPAIAALEARIRSSVEHAAWMTDREGRPAQRIASKSFSAYGFGRTVEEAVADFLVQNGLGE